VTTRFLSAVILIAAVFAFIFRVEGSDAFALRNGAPLLILLLLVFITLRMGAGTWTGSGWRWPLATLGFAIPSVGLSLYLHYGFLTDRNGMVSGALYPEMLFEFLPIYTVVAGLIGFAIGWIVGRNV
jgi:hypothetical protein